MFVTFVLFDRSTDCAVGGTRVVAARDSEWLGESFIFENKCRSEFEFGSEFDLWWRVGARVGVGAGLGL